MRTEQPFRRLARALALSFCLAVAVGAPGQNRQPISGCEIAPVMGAAAADWLVRPER